LIQTKPTVLYICEGNNFATTAATINHTIIFNLDAYLRILGFNTRNKTNVWRNERARILRQEPKSTLSRPRKSKTYKLDKAKAFIKYYAEKSGDMLPQYENVIIVPFEDVSDFHEYYNKDCEENGYQLIYFSY
jgi:hypothetical protein